MKIELLEMFVCLVKVGLLYNGYGFVGENLRFWNMRWGYLNECFMDVSFVILFFRFIKVVYFFVVRVIIFVILEDIVEIFFL